VNCPVAWRQPRYWIASILFRLMTFSSTSAGPLGC
jgi:hypothetical protein